jgi:hypothetical protein
MAAISVQGATSSGCIDMYRDPRLEFAEPIDSHTGIMPLTEKENMENENATQTKINWDVFESKSKDDRIEIEVGKKYELGFTSLRQGQIDVDDEESGQKKKLDVLILGVDVFDGKPVKKEYTVTSKRLAQTVKTYFEKGMLFTRIFQLEKTGTGFQTLYQLMALQEKATEKKA